MWTDKALEMNNTNTKQQILNDSNHHIQQFTQLHSKYMVYFSNFDCWTDFQIQPTIFEMLNQYGYVGDMKKKLSPLNLQLKNKTHESITITWQNVLLPSYT